MTLVGRRFELSSERHRGIFCSQDGLFVGGVPILERIFGNDSSEQWRPRPAIDLNRDLSKRYGVPVEIVSKMERLEGIGQALDRGDHVYAMIATLHLEFPDPPDLTRSTPGSRGAVDLSRSLKARGLLKADWNPSKHPRWPVGSADGIGGEFAPAGSSADSASGPAESNPQSEVAQAIPARLDTPDGISLTPVSATTLPIPFEIPGFSLPSEIAPGPLLPPNVNPLHIPRNPYPDRPKCVKEWAQATSDCLDLLINGSLGTDDYRGMGRNVAECIIGRVSEDCGGNRLDA
jgi:hypothetical protein